MAQPSPCLCCLALCGEDTLGATMSEHEHIQKIAFTGSGATGRKLMSAATATLKRLTLELGGNDAGIVLPDIDPKQMAEGLFWGAFINNGQTCAAPKRLYVPDDVSDEVCDSLTGFARAIPVRRQAPSSRSLGAVPGHHERSEFGRMQVSRRPNQR
jgi:acyl-CoA reductase-like NAD-dependent aldehyde dehydrogenase